MNTFLLMVHRQKDPTDRNATAVVDRAIQTLKKDLAGEVARQGGGWGDHVDEATEAYNARPSCCSDGGPGKCRDDAGRELPRLSR